MDDSPAIRRTPWLLIIGAWTAYGLATSAQSMVSSAMRGMPLGWKALVLQMPQAWIWALATPGILYLGRRFPLERGRYATSIAVHVLASCALIFLLSLGYTWHAANVLPPAIPRPVLRTATLTFVIYVFSESLLYWIVLLVSYAAERQRRLRERDVAASELETQLVRADLQALKMQLQPHFLFNALHTIGALIRTGDRDKAVRMVTGLGDLLRRVLDRASAQEVPLEHELAFISRYLDIEQIRFEDRLKVTVDVPRNLMSARVPHLVLQPLVENAIRHGIAPHASAGLIMVSAWRLDDRLELVVRDDGPGVTNGGTRPGIGLANTRARLNRLYGHDFRLEVINAAGGGVEARLSIPYAEMNGEAPAA